MTGGEPPPLALPTRHEVHLWLVKEAPSLDPDRRTRYASWLSEEERARWQRFRFAQDRDRFLLARGLVRGALTRYRPQVAENEWRFAPNAHGRPFLAEDQQQRLPLHFNLSHTRGLVALAVAGSREIGVDVEPISREGPHLSMADRYFAPAEVAALRALTDSRAHQQRFLELWTLKESYIKARGMGLALALDSFAFHLEQPREVSLRTWPAAGDTAVGWTFASLGFRSTHRLALALREDEAPSVLDIRVVELAGADPGSEQPLDLWRHSCREVCLGVLAAT